MHADGLASWSCPGSPFGPCTAFGDTWRIIGQLLGVSGQAARKRFVHLGRPALPSLDRGPERWGETEHHFLAAHARQLRLATDLAAWKRSGVDIVPW